MDSLAAAYGSSDEEDKEKEKPHFPPPRPPKPSFLGSLPPPKSSPSSSSSSSYSSSSIFSSLPPAKSSPSSSSSSSSSIFSSLPPAKSSSSSSFFSSLPPPRPTQQIRPTPRKVKEEEEEEEEEEKRKRRKKTQDFSSSKPLSSIIPAPKHTLGLAPASSRRSLLESIPPVSDNGPTQMAHEAQWAESYDARQGHDWSYEASSSSSAGEMMTMMMMAGEKRGRKEIPTEIVEVKQEELVKNRPREDQVKLTGIAFGPAYQPVASGGKGKPSKLHKRKHQIGSLYFDMRQKETELAERRSRGLLTKKETQAKYGW